MSIQRVEKLQKKMLEIDIDAMLIIRPENRLYLTGFTGSAGFILVTKGNCYLLTDFRYVEQAGKQAPHCQVINYGNDLFGIIKSLLSKEELKSLGFEEDYVSYQQYKSWQSKLQSISLVPYSGLVEKLRLLKDENEIKLLRKAAQIADAGFKHIIDFLKPGRTEKEVALELEYFMRQQGASGPAFETIVASGFRSSLPHGVASDKPIATGELILIDFGAVFQGYHSDMTRTVIIGKASAEQKRLYSTVLEAQLMAVKAVRPGMKCSELDNVARAFLTERGFEKEFGHSLGHGVGLAIHEEPRVAATSDTVLESSMAITIEPGVYISQFGGVRIEDLVIVTAEGCDNLTQSTKELLEL